MEHAISIMATLMVLNAPPQTPHQMKPKWIYSCEIKSVGRCIQLKRSPLMIGRDMDAYPLFERSPFARASE